MAKKLEVDIEVNTKSVEGSIAQLRELKKQLKNTAAGSKDFKDLVNQIDDLEDKLKGSKQGAADWIDTLENAGGPLGILGKGLNSAKVAFTSFNTALKTSVIGIVVSLIGGFVAALSKSEETTKRFEPILIMFEQALNGILGALEPLISGFLDLATRVMPYITSTFKVAYSAVTALFQSLGKLGSAVVKLIKGDFSGAWEDAKASVTSFGDNYEAATVRFEAGTKKITKTQKENLDKQKKDREDAEKDRQQREEEAFKVEVEAYKARLDDRAKELFEAEQAYEERRKTLLRAGITDFTNIEEQRRIEIKKINEKYDKEEQEKQQDRLKRFIEGLKQRKEKEIKGLEDSLMLEESRLKALQEGTREYFQQQRSIEDAAYALQKEKAKGNTKQLEAIEKTHKATLRNIDQAEFEAKKNLQLQIADLYGGFGRALKELAGKNKALAIAGLLIEQAAGVATIIINTQKAASKAGYFTPLGIATLVAGAASVAAAVAATIKGIKQIKQVDAEGGGGSQSASAEAPPPTFTGAPQSQPIPQLGAGGEASPGLQIAQTLSQVTQRPIRAFVVSSEIQSQTALDRRTNRGATFNLG